MPVYARWLTEVVGGMGGEKTRRRANGRMEEWKGKERMGEYYGSSCRWREWKECTRQKGKKEGEIGRRRIIKIK